MMLLRLVIGLTTAHAEVDPNFHIYLCFGQSNMEGQAQWETIDNEYVDPRFQMLSTDNFNSPKRSVGEWYTALCPIVHTKGKLGPTDYFGRTMVAALPANARFGVIAVAMSGCPIEIFDKDKCQQLMADNADVYWAKLAKNHYGSNPYGRIIEMARKAQQVGVISGILLHQGCGNCGDPNWPSMVKKVYEDMLADLSLQAADVPLFVGEVLYEEMGGVCAAHNPIVAQVPSVIPTAHVVSAENIPGKDSYHFNAAGYRTLGRRYAAEALKVMGRDVRKDADYTLPENLRIFFTPKSIEHAVVTNADGTAGYKLWCTFEDGHREDVTSETTFTSTSSNVTAKWTDFLGTQHTVNIALEGNSSDVQTINGGYGPVGFVNCNDGINGVTGGAAGEVVRVTNRQDLANYAKASEPYTIIVEGKLEGHGLNRQKDVIEVNSNKTIVGVKGAELAGIGLNINGKQNIIIRNLIIHHADPDGIAARNSHHIWIDHCEVYSQDEEKEDWDGLIDLTVGSSYLTVSYCYLHDHHKACLLNSGTMHYEDNGKNRTTYHHNAFLRIDQRCPRIGYGLGHVFCNYYQDIGWYAIGVHTQAKVVSENNYFGTNVKHPFEQMYASSLDDASCGFFTDSGSHFTATPPKGFKYEPTGTDFDPSLWYESAFAIDGADVLDTIYPTQTGPVESLEHEPILWPGNGAIDLPLNTKLSYSKIEGLTGAEVYFGTSPDNLQLTDISTLTTHLSPLTTYYWRVKALTAQGSYSSPLYRFTTAGVKASKPLPADGEQYAKLRAATSAEAKTGPMTLAWRPAANVKSYLVYLSTSEEDLDNHLVKTTTATSCNPGTLLYGPTYYWRVDVELTDGTVVKGDVWTFSAPARPITVGRTEMEHLARSAYAYLEREDGTWFKASNDSVTVGEAGPGAITGVWTGESGNYQVSVDFYDEKAGQAWMGLSVNDVLVDSWKGVKQYAMTTHTVAKELTLNTGDQIRIDFYTQSKMRCRIDCIDIKAGSAGIGEIILPDAIDQNVAVYNLSGQRVGRDYKGIVIINGKKIMQK